MKKPEHLRRSPWQRGKTPGTDWTPNAWASKMEGRVQATLQAAATEKKKVKKRNKGKKRKEWMSKRIEAWKAYEEEHKGYSSRSTSSRAASSGALAPAEPKMPPTPKIPPWRDPARTYEHVREAVATSLH